MDQASIPLVILGGSDRTAVELPPEAEGHHALAGYKGVEILLEGRPLIACILERLRAFPLFDPIWIAGPKRVYEPAGLGVEILDTDSSIGRNLQVCFDTFLARYASGHVAFLSCDVLPDPAEMSAVLEDFERSRDAVIWYPVVRVPRDRERLQSFAWKPKYWVSGREGEDQLQVLPGHLVIGDPRGLELELGYRMLEIAYRTRNRSLRSRRGSMAWGLLSFLLREDFGRLLRLRWPGRTAQVLGNGIRIAQRLRRRSMTIPELEARMVAVAVRPEFRDRNGGRPLCFPVTEALSLAEDIDTEEEARDLGGTTAPPGEIPAEDRFLA